MHENYGKPQALFLFSNGRLISDDLICSGKISTQFKGSCKYAADGRMPGVVKLKDDQSGQISRLGKVGDLAPKCALEQLGSLEQWQATIGETYPAQFLQMRVYKCRQMLMFVVPGIHHEEASDA